MQTVVYDEKNQSALDVYEASHAKAGIILIHGGGWFRGDKQKDQHLAEKLVAEDFTVIVPNYRLAPQNLYPAPVMDLLNVYQWTLTNFPQFKGKLAAWGSSAGGNLAIELALQKGIPAVSWSGIIDLIDWVSQHEDVVAAMNQEQHFDRKASSKIDQDGANDPFYKWFVLNYVAGDEALLTQADPLQRVTKTSGPLFLANSLNEFVPLSGVFKLQHALSQEQIETVTQLIPGSAHGEGYLSTAYPQALLFVKQNLFKID
ncbi:alpha/beta hydrolase fold domain-containing protein [Enterococcus sp. CSURQ0835]|uniref:alpha/beta hydrolase fold domain-containing protein n=1 Tax=Enterococcus sp. CSURQ0835 TaxID=2681394 RepID=UPI00135B1D16|nr:alpha/beta hydrolase [Enterococcus sp. CSURQ0835]